MKPTHLSLFSGIGGIDIAAEWAGFETVACVEKDHFCRQILEEVFPSAIIYSDIRRFKFADLRARRSVGSVDLLTGGFPCQPFSIAGKRKGKSDDRFLWPQMLRVIRESKPTWIVGENVAHLTNMVEFESVCTDLEAEGYEVQPLIIPACGVGALHVRKRVFIVAYSEHRRRRKGRSPGQRQERSVADGLRSGRRSTNVSDADRAGQSSSTQGGYPSRDGSIDVREDVPDTISEGCDHWAIQRIQKEPAPSYADALCRVARGEEFWFVEPEVGRVADGIPYRVDSLRTLGNAVVPQHIYPVLMEIFNLIIFSRA